MNIFEELPMGLAMALAKNPQAMTVFGEMNEQEKQNLIDMTHSVTSKSEMQSMVARIVEGVSK